MRVNFTPQAQDNLEAIRDWIAVEDVGLVIGWRTGAVQDAVCGPRRAAGDATDPEARYDRFDQVVAEVKRAGITRLGFAGNEAMVE